MNIDKKLLAEQIDIMSDLIDLEKDEKIASCLEGVNILLEEILKQENSKKLYYIMNNVGRAKYTVNAHDGKSFHKDGSDFYGIDIFSNKKKRDAFIKSLEEEGYTRK